MNTTCPDCHGAVTQGKCVACGWAEKPVKVAARPRPFVLTKWADPREGAYNDFRARLLAGWIGPVDDRTHDPRGIVQRHAEELGKWLDNPVNTDWAAKFPQGDCQRCPDRDKPSHTLLACIVREQRYWAERHAGKTEREAKEAIGF